jgi:hypothetical protein
MKTGIISLMLLMPFFVVKGQNKLSVGPIYPLQKKMTLSSMPAKPAAIAVFAPKAVAPVGPRDYYNQEFGYFCKREWRFEQQTRVPLKFRLGTYQEAQRIEGK